MCRIQRDRHIRNIDTFIGPVFLDGPLNRRADTRLRFTVFIRVIIHKEHIKCLLEYGIQMDLLIFITRNIRRHCCENARIILIRIYFIIIIIGPSHEDIARLLWRSRCINQIIFLYCLLSIVTCCAFKNIFRYMRTIFT